VIQDDHSSYGSNSGENITPAEDSNEATTAKGVGGHKMSHRPVTCMGEAAFQRPSQKYLDPLGRLIPCLKVTMDYRNTER